MGAWILLVLWGREAGSSEELTPAGDPPPCGAAMALWETQLGLGLVPGVGCVHVLVLVSAVSYFCRGRVGPREDSAPAISGRLSQHPFLQALCSSLLEAYAGAPELSTWVEGGCSHLAPHCQVSLGVTPWCLWEKPLKLP